MIVEYNVMPRKRHVSRNVSICWDVVTPIVMPRKRHVSRNVDKLAGAYDTAVMPRKRHVSRNDVTFINLSIKKSCLARGM